MRYDILYFFAALIVVFILTVLTLKIIIPKLKSHKMGQKILDIGPRWHKSKEGTPTMGGISFIFSSVVIVAVILAAEFVFSLGIDSRLLLLTFGFAVSNGIIGLLDDYVKFFKKQNEGLKAYQKYFLQLVSAGAYLFLMNLFGYITTALPIPFTDIVIELHGFYYFFAIILLTGMTNSVNLTDGIDGLAATVTSAVGAFFAVWAFTSGNTGGALLSAVLLGGCLGFLVYNFYPARIFMGDTGSLYLGALVCGLAFMMNNPLIIVIAGLMYVVETLSVILQVASFKLTGKRLFKMSPIHHHFEKCGWSEVKIVSVFGIITVVLCIISYFGV